LPEWLKRLAGEDRARRLVASGEAPIPNRPKLASWGRGMSCQLEPVKTFNCAIWMNQARHPIFG
jgi:hypothetical protein